MFARFTDGARQTMALANQEARRLDCARIGTEHILLGLVARRTGAGAGALQNLVDLEDVRREVLKLAKRGPEAVAVGKLPQTRRAKRVVEHAIDEAQNLSHTSVGSEHLLLGLLREPDGLAAQALMNLRLRPEIVRDEVLRMIGVTSKGEDRGPSFSLGDDAFG